jgi:hypothetical protein
VITLKEAICPAVITGIAIRRSLPALVPRKRTITVNTVEVPVVVAVATVAVSRGSMIGLIYIVKFVTAVAAEGYLPDTIVTVPVSSEVIAIVSPTVTVDTILNWRLFLLLRLHSFTLMVPHEIAAQEFLYMLTVASLVIESAK